MNFPPAWQLIWRMTGNASRAASVAALLAIDFKCVLFNLQQR